jgi:hypothetical protein
VNAGGNVPPVSTVRRTCCPSTSVTADGSNERNVPFSKTASNICSIPATPFDKTILSMDYRLPFQHTECRPSAARQRASDETSRGVLRRGERLRPQRNSQRSHCVEGLLAASLVPLCSGLRRGQCLDRDITAIYGLDRQLVAFQQGHSDQRMRIGSVRRHEARPAIPDHACLVDIEKDFAAIGKQSTAAPTKRKPEFRNEGWWQAQ